MYYNLLVLIFCFVFGNQVDANSSNLQRTENCIDELSTVNDSVRFDCNGSSIGGNHWKYNEMSLYVDGNVVTAVKNVELYSNNSLFIGNISIDHEGVFQCISNSLEVARYCLYVRVPPKLKLSINGHSNNVAQIESNEELVVTCQAIGSRPPTDLIWRVDGHRVNTTENVTKNVFDDRIFDTVSELRFYPRKANGTITCSDTQQLVSQVNVSYFVFVSPIKVFLLLDGEDVLKGFTVLHGKSLNVTCVARDARPPVTLTLIIDNITLSPSDVETSTLPQNHNLYNVTYDSWIWMEYKPTEENHTVTCVSSSYKPQQERQTTITVHVLANRKSSEDTVDKGVGALPFIALALIVAVLLTLSTISCLVWRSKARNDERSSYFGVTLSRQDEPSISRKASIIAGPKSPKSEGSVKETTFTYDFAFPQEGTKSECPTPPKLELPEVPYVERSSMYENPSVTEGVYYSDLKEEVAVGKLFHRQEMCLIMSLKAGKVHNRWMGSIAETNSMTKCVFVSTVTEKILRTREIQWDVYVKRILELPQSNSLTNTEGICIDGVQLFLVQEHFNCVPLDSHIQLNRRDADDGTSYTTFTSSQIRTWVVDVLKGMEIVHSYGLLHPGLSSKKILVTNDNVLKLYDFCLSDDAQRKVLLLKDKMECSLNELAPEALLRNEYKATSDVWSIAVVIWELLTATTPFPGDSEVILHKSESLFHGTWPSKYVELRNNYVFNCWRQDCTIRPTMRQLRFSFDENYVQVEQSEALASDQYVPMRGFIQGQVYGETSNIKNSAANKDEKMTTKRKLIEVSKDDNKKSNSV